MEMDNSAADRFCFASERAYVCAGKVLQQHNFHNPIPMVDIAVRAAKPVVDLLYAPVSHFFNS
jgi:hypothetical protein